MDWKQLISLKPVICQLLKSNNCWFWGDQLFGLRLEFKLFSGWKQFEHGPDSIWIQTVFRRETVWTWFETGYAYQLSLKTVWNQLCVPTQIKIVDLKIVTDLKTVIFWKQLWIRITGHFGGPVIRIQFGNSYGLKTVTRIENSYLSVIESG